MDCVHSEYYDIIWLTFRVTWVFPGCIVHLVGFVLFVLFVVLRLSQHIMSRQSVKLTTLFPGLDQVVYRSAVGNVSGYRCESDCKFRGREFDPSSVPYFHGD